MQRATVAVKNRHSPSRADYSMNCSSGTISSTTGATTSDKPLPVFAYPTHLQFNISDQSTYKQVLTLYNPYEFTLKFKVLCTAPKKFTVVDSEGLVKPRCCVDIVIRHLDIRNSEPGDRFRIEIFEHGTRKVIGRKDIPVAVSPSGDNESQGCSGESVRRNSPPPAKEARDSLEKQLKDAREASNASTNPNILLILVAVICIFILMLPGIGDSNNSGIPFNIFLSVNQKLVAAYVLGLVTMAILRP